MKKIVLILMVLVLSSGAAFSQHSLPMGRTQLDAGFGLSGNGIPIYVGLDYAFHKDMTVGGEISYRDNNNYWRAITISGNFNYHFNYAMRIPREWDFYLGAKIGYINYSNYSGVVNSNSNLALGGQLGGRYFINPNFGFNLELAFGNLFNDGRLGITYKF